MPKILKLRGIKKVSQQVLNMNVEKNQKVKTFVKAVDVLNSFDEFFGQILI